MAVEVTISTTSKHNVARNPVTVVLHQRAEAVTETILSNTFVKHVAYFSHKFTQ